MQDDFISRYLQYTRDTEAPAIYHRWCILSSIAAYLGRSCYVRHGHFNIFPNMYIILVGGAGTRKNSAIKIPKRLIQSAGYSSFAASKTTKEKLFIRLSELNSNSAEDILDQNLFGDETHEDISISSEVFIVSGEFNTFFGNNILSFLEDLGELWDFEGPFTNEIKTGKSVTIMNPTINILGGTTPVMFAKTFPPEFIGQGFFSRCFLVYGEKTRPRITFPEEPPEELTQNFIEEIKSFRPILQKKLGLTPGARKLIDAIYNGPELLDDPRFETFYNRRLTNLFKLSVILAATEHLNQINENIVLYANTILAHVEQLMPKALGEFGRAKNSDVAHKVLSIIQNSKGVTRTKDIWKHVSKDLEKLADLSVILSNLKEADKIQVSQDPPGFLPINRSIMAEIPGNNYVDYSLLTAEERGMQK